MALPLTVQFNTHDEADTPVFEQGDNWEDNIVWDLTRSVPQANYQGQRVNFSQPTMTQYNTHNIERINTSLYQYPQQSNLASAKSDTDIWNHINRYIWGKSGSQSSPKGNWQANPNAIVPRINNLQEQINSGKKERDSIQAKIKSNKDEHGYFHDTVQSLGNSLKTKAGINHSHNIGGGNGGGNGDDCGWFGEKCWENPFDLGIGSSLTTMAAIGVGAYLLLKKK